MTRPFWLSLSFAVLVACNSAQLSSSPAGANTSPSDSCIPTDEEPCPSAEDAGAPPKPSREAGASNEGGALPTSEKVTIQIQPSDLGAAVVSAIRGAARSVHMTMYLLSSNEVIKALGDLKAAGKDVKVVLNKTFPPNGGDNLPAYNALVARGVDVRWASSSYTFTHAKTIVIDGATAIIMTMNLTYTSPATNREYIATDTDEADVADCEQLFEADYANTPVALTSKLVISPSSANRAGNPQTQLKSLIASAKASLDIEIQSLSDTALVDAIIKAHQAGVEVRLVIDGDTSDSPAQKSAISKLKAAGVPLRSLSSPDLHAKVIVVDGAHTFVGSQNFTSTALFQNREVGVVVDSEAEATKVRDTIASDFGKGTMLP